MKKYIPMTVLPTLSFICRAQQYEVGTTTVIWKNPVAADLVKAKMQGMHYMEVALSQCYRGVPVEEVIPRIKLMKSRVDSAGIQVWSTHLPSPRTLDISILDDSFRAKNVRFMAQMIGQCGQFKPARLILHPSPRPVADNVRARRIVDARRSIIYLKPCTDRIGTQLCIENLPHICLGSTPEELLKIICGTPEVKVCSDTNHYSKGSIERFMKMLGRHIGTVHASDFDLINGSHWLSTQGEIDWQHFIKELRSNGYKGAFIYETMRDYDHDKARLVPLRTYETFKNIAGSEQ